LFPKHSRLPRQTLDEFYRLPVTPEILQVLELLYEDGRADPTEVLIEHAMRMENEFDLYSVALALRHKAKVNFYVDDGPVKIHFLGALIKTHRIEYVQEDSLFWKLIVILKEFGADATQPFVGTSEFVDTRSVLDWLGSYADLYKIIVLKPSFYYSALLGRSELNLNLKITDASGTQRVTEMQYKFLVKSRSYSTFRNKLSFENVTSRVEVDSVVPFLALQFYEERAFVDFVQDVALPSYPLINELCVRCSKGGIAGEVWKKTLRKCVSYGLVLDRFQLSLVGTWIQPYYSVPYWEKFFKSNHERKYPARIKNLARAVSGKYYDQDFKYLKGKLKKASVMDPDRLERIILKREKKPFTTQPVCVGKCKGEPLLLLEDYRVVFSDKGTLYVIQSNEYKNAESLLADLSGSARKRVLEKIKKKVKKIRREGGSPDDALTYASILENEFSPDEITDERSQFELAKFFVSVGGPVVDAAEYSGVYNLSQLSPEHAIVTLAYIHNSLQENS
jgi:hypothetical protein